MTKMELSEAATKALINVPSSHMGARETLNLPYGVFVELMDAGLVGPRGGLTRAGSIAAMRLKRAAEDAAFA